MAALKKITKKQLLGFVLVRQSLANNRLGGISYNDESNRARFGIDKKEYQQIVSFLYAKFGMEIPANISLKDLS